MDELIKRFNIQDIFNVKIKLLSQLSELEKLEEDIKFECEKISTYPPFRIDYRFGCYGNNQKEQYIDQQCWEYLIQFLEISKYMACTEYQKLQKDIEEFRTPQFTIENITGWLAGLKELIYNNVYTLTKKVFDALQNGAYYTGSGYSSRKKKKRNNTEIEKYFILHTNDYIDIHSYITNRVSITDDLEKLCYLLDGEKVPDIVCKDLMRSEKMDEYENKYFTIRVCKNGNTHYWIKDFIRDKLNLIGSDKSKIGENIKIKIFEKKY